MCDMYAAVSCGGISARPFYQGQISERDASSDVGCVRQVSEAGG
jgi:hypothetical protein